MPQFLELSPPAAALKTFLDHLPAANPAAEKIKTSQSLHRILLEEIVATEPLPAFSRSTVDGYAVHAADTFGASESMPAYLPCIGEVPMGASPAFHLPAGFACLIHTGGMLPEGANAVVMLETTQIARQDEIEIYKAVAVGENIIQAGEDVRAGECVIKFGTRLRPAEIGGLLALGITEISVAVPPKVGILSSGDEIVLPESQPKPGQVRDINSYSLAALVEAHGGQPRLYGIAPDDLAVFEPLIQQAFQECDMLIVTAGSSASARDLTADAIRKLGKPGVLVHGVAIRPGKPTILAVCNGKPVIGLPGNPVSALVIANLFAIPTLERIAGLTFPSAIPVIKAALTVNVSSTAGREDYVPVKLNETTAGLLAHPIFFKSNMIFSLVQADGLLRIPSQAVGLNMGEIVDILLLQ